MKRARSSGWTTSWPSTWRIASPPVLYSPAWKLSFSVAALQPGLLCRAARDDFGEQAAVGRVEAELRARAAGRAPGWRRRCRRIRRCRLLQLRDRALDRRDRHGEADAVVGAGVGLDLLVDPEHPGAAVEQRAAGVAGVDRGVGLDRPLDLELGQRFHRAVGGRDDPDRERVLLAEGAADRRDRLADDESRDRRRASAGAGRGRRASTFSRATSAKGSKPTISARDDVAVGELDEDFLGGRGRRRSIRR